MNTTSVKSLLLFIFCFVLLSACKTPSYKKVSDTSEASNFSQEVQYSISENFDFNNLECIAVGKITKSHNNDDFINLNQEELVRKSLYGVLSAKNYADVDLARVDYIMNSSLDPSTQNTLNSLNCDALMTADILSFKNKYLLAYSITSVEIEAKLVDKNEKLIWSSRHMASSHEGAIPLSPFSLISGVFVAATNRQDEVAFQMIDAATRRILNTLPDRNKVDLVDQIITSIPSDFLEDKTEDVKLQQSSKTSIEMLIAKGAFEEALIQAELNIEEDNNNATAYFFAGRSSLMLGKYAKAIDYNLTAIAKGYETAEVYSSLGIAYLKSKKMSLASASITKASNLEPNNSYLKYNLGVIREAEKNIPAASDAYYDAGIIALEQEDLDRLYRSFSSLKKLSQSNDTAMTKYGQLGQKISVRNKN